MCCATCLPLNKNHVIERPHTFLAPIFDLLMPAVCVLVVLLQLISWARPDMPTADNRVLGVQQFTVLRQSSIIHTCPLSPIRHPVPDVYADRKVGTHNFHICSFRRLYRTSVHRSWTPRVPQYWTHVFLFLSFPSQHTCYWRSKMVPTCQIVSLPIDDCACHCIN